MELTDGVRILKWAMVPRKLFEPPRITLNGPELRAGEGGIPKETNILS